MQYDKFQKQICLFLGQAQTPKPSQGTETTHLNINPVIYVSYHLLLYLHAKEEAKIIKTWPLAMPNVKWVG